MDLYRIRFYQQKEVRGSRIRIGFFEDFIPFDDEIEEGVDHAFDLQHKEEEWIDFIKNLFSHICILHPPFQDFTISYSEEYRKFTINEIRYTKEWSWSVARKEERTFEYYIDSWGSMSEMTGFFISLTKECFKAKGKELSHKELPESFDQIAITLNKAFKHNLVLPVEPPEHLDIP